MVTIRFGVPVHGWLPVEIDFGDFTLQLDASDVPVNPLDELCSALILVLQGASTEVGWHLEPAWCFLRFETTNNSVTLVVFESAAFKGKADEKLRVTSSVEELVLPWYRALKSFCTADYGADWPATDVSGIEKLTQLVKARKKRL